MPIVFGERDPFHDALLTDEIIKTILPQSIAHSQEFMRNYKFNSAVLFLQANGERPNHSDAFIQKLHESGVKLSEDLGLDRMPHLLSGRSPISDPELSTKERTLITLASIPIIDTSNTTWEQILEFRKSNESRAKLRRLIHFFDQL